ncbi:MAG: hypothetical protein RLZZ380_2 [Actinomycetota bacterium]
MKIRRLIASGAALALTLLSSSLPAQADPAPTLTLANNGVSLTGSALSNFTSDATYRLQLVASSGVVKVDLGSSGATVAPGAGLTGNSVAITGTPAQLNAALETTTLSQNCSATRTITGTVTPGVDYVVRNPADGHLYTVLTSNSNTWADARAAAKAKTLPGTTGFGYLANITSAAENTFVNENFSGTPFLGASDGDLEGDWYWMDGPEAGTKFYSAGSAVNNSFVKWGTDEPNNVNNAEHYLQLWHEDTWNDIPTSNTSLVEFGGMPGDDFTGFVAVTATANVSLPVLMQGSGTLASPYQVEDFSDFLEVPSCDGAGVHFKQTENLSLASTFSGSDSFTGFYDGNGKTIDASLATEMTGSLFGTVSGATTPLDTSIKNLTIVGPDRHEAFSCEASVVARNIHNATIEGLSVTGAKISTDCEAGILALGISNSIVKNTNVSGQIDFMTHVFGGGGLAASIQGTQVIDTQCSVTFGESELFPFHHMIDSIGGCVGQSNQSNFLRVSSSGSYGTDQQNNFPFMRLMNIGGLIGTSYQDTISDSSSSMSLTTNEGMNVGGLIGVANLSTVNRSFATGNVTDTLGSSIGGLVGYAAASTISNVYSTGAVSGDNRVGGLVGYLAAGSSVSKALSTGLVTSTDSAQSRGMIGNSDSPTVTDSYWRIHSTGVPSTVESIGQEVPKLPGELKRASTFANWAISANPSSAHDWAICPSANGGYPYLAWQEVPGGCARSFVSGASVSVNGVAYVGGTLTAVPSNFDPLATLSYQWMEGTAVIAGATTAYYKPTSNSKGKKLSVRVTASKDGYVSSETHSGQFVVAGTPKATVVALGGFAAKASKSTPALKAAIAKANKGIGIVLSIKCEGFTTAKALSAAQKKLALARAATVCAALKLTHKGSTVKNATSIAKKADKIAEGVRVTLTSVKP